MTKTKALKLNIRVVLFGVISSRTIIMSSSTSSSIKQEFSKVLVLKKYTRYEKLSKTYDTDGRDLKVCLQDSGWDVSKIVASHEIQQNFENAVKTELARANIEYRFVTKNEYTEDQVQWADAILTLGGDGTFLQAANKIRDRCTLLIGFNSMPETSTGHLCLPKYYSQNLKEAITKIKEGKYKNLHRTRIKVSLRGSTSSHYLHSDDPPSRPRTLPENEPKDFQILPELALNDVYVGEYNSALVSKLIISTDQTPPAQQVKCSGMCINTGSGSTAWYYTINKLNQAKVAQLLCLAGIDASQSKVADITDKYNKSLQFSPDDSRLAFAIRDMISGDETMPETGYVQSLKIKSMCTNGAIMIDGNIGYDFHPGAEICLETCRDYDLNTIELT
uniref:NAD(+) kinase n=1 Tax=Cacopsylla melanoneura TaxID=428564 RepID=A0A8D9DS78_9HEMI